MSSPKCSRNHQRNNFTSEEDFKLKQLVKKYGDNDWAKIAGMFHNRNERQVKERWCNYLSPDLVKTPMSNEEDQLLLYYVNLIGRKWKTIAGLFPGRTDIQLKSRFNVIMRKGLRNQKKEMKNWLSSETKNSFSAKSENSSTSYTDYHVQDNQVFDELFNDQLYDSFEFENELFEF